MKLCFSTLGCPEWSFEDIVATACDLGYDGIELRGVKNELDGTRIPQLAPNEGAKTREWLKKKKLEIACLTSACYMNDKNIAEDTLFHAQAYVDTAFDSDIKNVRLLADYGPEQSGELDTPFIAGQIKRIADYAKPLGVTILVETNGYYANSERMVALMNAIDMENVGVLWDIHHPYRYFHETPEQTVGMLGDLVRHVHIKDSSMENGKLKYKVVGAGDIPVKECVQRLLEIGYDGYFSLEWLKRWDLSLEEPGIAFASYISYMRSL